MKTVLCLVLLIAVVGALEKRSYEIDAPEEEPPLSQIPAQPTVPNAPWTSPVHSRPSQPAPTGPIGKPTYPSTGPWVPLDKPSVPQYPGIPPTPGHPVIPINGPTTSPSPPNEGHSPSTSGPSPSTDGPSPSTDGPSPSTDGPLTSTDGPSQPTTNGPPTSGPPSPTDGPSSPINGPSPPTDNGSSVDPALPSGQPVTVSPAPDLPVSTGSAAPETKPPIVDVDAGEEAAEAEPFALPIVTSVTCKGRHYGYYADPFNCNIFVICNPIEHPDGTVEIHQHNQRCPFKTVFNQKILTCTLPEEAPPCKSAPDWYWVNDQFGVIPPNCTTTTSTTIATTATAA